MIDLTGTTTLRQTISLLKRCKLYIGNDSGLMHLAAAMKVPIVEISCWPKNGDKFHHNSPYRFGPWKTRAVVVNPEKAIEPCLGGCTKFEPHCILQVEVEDVKGAAEKLLRGQNVNKKV